MIRALAIALLLGSGNGQGLSGGNGPSRNRGAANSAPAQNVPVANALSTFHDGDNDVVSLGKPANMDLTVGSSTFTMSLWFKRGEAADFERHMGGKATMAGGGQVGVVAGARADEAIEALVYGGENTFGGNIAPGGVFGWHCWSLSINGTSAKLYLDGAQVGSTFTVGSGPWSTTPSWLLGGSRGSTDDSTEVWYPWKGWLDESTFWSSNFSDADHLALCGGGVPIDPTTHAKSATLLHWYRHGDGDTFPTLTDRAGSANGTCQNMTSAGVNFVSDHP